MKNAYVAETMYMQLTVSGTITRTMEVRTSPMKLSRNVTWVNGEPRTMPSVSNQGPIDQNGKKNR